MTIYDGRTTNQSKNDAMTMTTAKNARSLDGTNKDKIGTTPPVEAKKHANDIPVIVSNCRL